MGAFLRRDDFVTDVLGNAIAGAQVYYLTNQPGATTSTVSLTSLASIFSDSTGLQTAINPVFTDGFGHANTGFVNVAAYMADGAYSVAYVVNGIVLQVYNDQQVGFPSAGIFTSITLPEGTAPTGVPANDILFGDSTAHRVKMINNNGATDTVVGAATVDAFSNKTFDTATTGNIFKINGNSINAVSGAGAVVLQTSPTIRTGFTLQTSTGTLGASITNDTVGGVNVTTNGGKTWEFANGGSLSSPPGAAVQFNGGTSGLVNLAAPSVAGSNNLVLPAATDTLVARATTDTLTNKTITSPVITSPTINSGVAQGSGFKTQRFGNPCTTTASAGASCVTTYTWTTAFADANYTVVCSGVDQGQAAFGNVDSFTASGLVFRVTAATAAPATFQAGVNCIAVHD